MPEKVFVRGIPDELWRAVKARASLDGMTVSRAVQEAIAAYLAGSGRCGAPEGTDPWLALVGLGSSGLTDVSDRHDAYLARAKRGRRAR